MKKYLTLIGLIFGHLVFAQNFNMSNNTVNVNCGPGGVVYDSGGAGGNYGPNENFVLTVCPSSPGFGVFATMDVMGIAPGDQLTIYNGDNTAAPSYPNMPLDNTTAYNVGAQFQSTVANPTGCLTFEFISNGDANVGSFQFTLECEARCQEVISEILTSLPDTTLENGDVFLDICLGDTLEITGNALYPQNNTEYLQSNATSTFTWNWGDNTPNDFGPTQSHYYPTPGGYFLNLSVEDVNGCRNFQDQLIKVRVAPLPDFVELNDTFMCVGELDTLTALPEGVIINGQVVQGGVEFFQPPIFSGDSLFLPDGNGAGYNSNTFLTSFGNGDQVVNCGDILEICITMEHSYLGDLEMTLICPNGQSAVLKAFPGGGGTFLGNPFDNGTIQIGSGLEYCFSPLGTTLLVNGPTQAATNTPGNTIQPGLYAPVDPFTNLVGCPLNGQWTLNITDNLTIDDGYLFNWELNFDPCLYPSIDSFTMLYNFGFWQNDPSINGIVGGNPNTIEIEPDTTGTYTYTYTTFDQFGCEYSQDYTFEVDGFEVEASPDTSVICAGQSVQLNANVIGAANACELDYLVYNIPYEKEIGSPTPFVFTQVDNGVSQVVPLPFPFDFYCGAVNNVTATTDGYVSFAVTGFSVPNNGAIPSAANPNNMIALMWDDLVDSSSLSGYFTTGVAPNRKFVIEFDLVHKGGTAATEPVKGQIILHETTNIVDIVCENCQQDVSDPSATQGVERFNGAVASVPPGRNNAAWSATQDAWRFFPQSSLNTNYTINWTPTAGLVGETTQVPIAAPNTSTNYVVEITNENNCSYSDSSVYVLVGGNYTYTITNDTTICPGDTVQLNVTGGPQTFAWTPNDGSISDTAIANPQVYPITTTTYSVELDSAGCIALDDVTITVGNISVDSTIVTTESCAGFADASISIFATGGANLQYSIDGGISFTNNNVFQPLAAGVYDILVNENGSCDTSYQVTILGGAILAFDSIVIADASCGNLNDGSINVYISGGLAPFTYSIDGGTNSQASNSFGGLSGGNYTVYVEDSLNCFVDSVVVLNQPAPLVIGADQVDSLSCFNTADGQIELLANGGVLPYDFSLDNINYSPDSVFTGLTEGSYTAYVQDANLCIDSIVVDVFAPPALALTIDSTNITCKDLSDGTATVTAVGGSGGFIYSWNDALSQNTASATNLDAGTYQVVVTDVNGCVDSATVNIEEPDSLILTLLGVTDVLCNGASTGAVSVNTAGGTTAYSYQWTNGGGSNEDLSGASAGTYTLTVTDANNCTDQLTAVIAEPPALSINLAGTDILCSGGADGEVDATVNGGVIPYTYAWTGPNGYTNNTEDVTGLTGGTYTLSVTDSNNCILTQTITINEPNDVAITFSDSPVNCFGGNDGSLTASVLSGGTAPFSFQWDAAANNQLTATATGLTAGTYTVTVTDANGCVYTNSASVSEPQAPLSIVMDSTNISCAGYNDGTGTASVSGGTPGYSYLWNDPQAQTTATATDLPSGIFQVTVTDANGCVITGSVNIEAPNAINISTVSDSTNCFGEATGGISVVASGGTGIGFAYSIDGGETFQSSPDFFNLPAGIYDEIIVQDLGSNTACLSPLTSATVYEQPYFTFEVVPGDTTLQLEESVNLSLNVTSPNYTNNDIAQVSWFPSTGLNCTDCVDPTVLTYDSYTEYTATVYYYGDDNELCNAVASTIIIVENNLALYIPNAFTPSNYDNVNNRFEVYGEGIEYVTMQIYNRIGEKIFESSNQQVGWDGTFKGELQNPGVYTYYVSVEYLDGKVIDRKGSVTLIR